MRGARQALLAGCVAAGAALLGTLAAPAAPAPAPAVPKLTFSITDTRAASGPRGATFFSIFPACGCGRRTVIGQFSRRTGRLVRALGTIRTDGRISNAATDARGGLWMTFTTGPALAAPPTNGGGPEPDTCSGALVRFDLRSGAVRTMTRFPTSVIVRNAVPSPDGRRVALLEGGCTTAYFNQHIVVLDVRSRGQIDIGADATPCHWLLDAAWSQDGARLVFPYGPSNLPANTSFVPNGTCLTPRSSGIAIASALRPSGVRSWTVWKAERGCNYRSADFDRAGIVAGEACSRGNSAGQAYLVQLDRHGRRLARLALCLPGCGAGAIAITPVRETGASASCAEVSPAAQFAAARRVLVGVMLPGPATRLDNRPVLDSPARMRVKRYLKGHGPSEVRIVTAVTTNRHGVTVAEDGIEPHAGERWKIYTGSRRQPFDTSICGGSVRLAAAP